MNGADSLSPNEAFTLLGNELRVEILQVLWEELSGPFDEQKPIPFSKLYDRVEYDDPGNFNYHLDKLVGHFVRRTDEGYTLREAGKYVVRAVLMGVITEDVMFGPEETDADCPYCGAPAELRYEDERLTARCTECTGAVAGEFPRGTYLSFPFPPSGFEGRTPEEVLRVARTFYDGKVDPMMEGVCPECAGMVTATIDICDDHAVDDERLCETCNTRNRFWVEYVCENCRYTRRSALWYRVLNQPEMISRYSERSGSSVSFRKLTWENPPYIEDITEEVVSRDPLEVRTTIRLDGETFRVTVGSDLRINEVA